jgi:hypothetical protein
MLVNKKAEKWIWDSIPSEGKKRLRKMWARQIRENLAAEMEAAES